MSDYASSGGPVDYSRPIGHDLPERCHVCGFHPIEQGHRAPCKPEGMGLVLDVRGKRP